MNHYSIGNPIGQNNLSIYTDSFTSTLKEFNVPEQYYSVGKIEEESICILPHGSRLEVFIWERGRKRSLKVFKEPKSAFAYAISLMAEDANEEAILLSSFLSKVAKHTSIKRILGKVVVTPNDSVSISIRSKRPIRTTSKKKNKLVASNHSRTVLMAAKKHAKVFNIGEVTVSALRKKRLQKLKQKLDPLKK